MKLMLKKTSDWAVVPFRATFDSAGYDLCALEQVIVPPGIPTSINTGIIISFPDGYYGQISSRSGLFFHHGVFTYEGIIDRDYCSELKVVLYNCNNEPYLVQQGEPIAQLLFVKVAHPEFEIQLPEPYIPTTSENPPGLKPEHTYKQHRKRPRSRSRSRSRPKKLRSRRSRSRQRHYHHRYRDSLDPYTSTRQSKYRGSGGFGSTSKEFRKIFSPYSNSRAGNKRKNRTPSHDSGYESFGNKGEGAFHSHTPFNKHIKTDLY